MRRSLSKERIAASTDTTRGKKKPVHEDSFTVVVRIICKQSMPLILLFTGTVVFASFGSHRSLTKKNVTEWVRKEGFQQHLEEQ
jgi:hypothetical protein